MSVVLLTAFPVHRPRNGGQQRIAQIEKAYRAAGLAAHTLTVCEQEILGEAGPGDTCIGFPVRSRFRRWQGRDVPLINDLLVGRFASEDERAYRAIKKRLPARVDCVDLHQPWLVPLVERLRREPAYRSAHVVYNSQNIEAPLKYDMLVQHGVADAQSIAHEVAALEQRAARVCDGVVAVSQADTRQLRAFGARHVVLAGNGIAANAASEAGLSRWRKRLPEAPFAVFVASAHPPNIKGFWDCFGDSLALLSPLQPLVLAGSAGPQVRAAAPKGRFSLLNESRLAVLGELTEDDLAAVKQLAHVFVLPITYGGGSNIKSAEALFSGKPVVGTPTAFRGFDAFVRLPGVARVAARPSVFRKAVAKALTTATPSPDSPAQRALRQSLLWQHSLRPLVDAMCHEWGRP